MDEDVVVVPESLRLAVRGLGVDIETGLEVVEDWKEDDFRIVGVRGVSVRGIGLRGEIDGAEPDGGFIVCGDTGRE